MTANTDASEQPIPVLGAQSDRIFQLEYPIRGIASSKKLFPKYRLI